MSKLHIRLALAATPFIFFAATAANAVTRVDNGVRVHGSSSDEATAVRDEEEKSNRVVLLPSIRPYEPPIYGAGGGYRDDDRRSRRRYRDTDVDGRNFDGFTTAGDTFERSYDGFSVVRPGAKLRGGGRLPRRR